ELNTPQQSDTRRVAADVYQEAGRNRDAELLRDVTRAVVLIDGCHRPGGAGVQPGPRTCRAVPPAAGGAEVEGAAVATRPAEAEPAARAFGRVPPARILQ